MRSLLALAICCGSVAAEPVTMTFSRASLETFATVVYREALGRSVVIDDAVITSPKLVSVDLRQVAPHNLRALADAALQAQGLAVVDRAGALHITTPPAAKDQPPPAPPAPVLHVYTPRHRTPADLAAALALQPPPPEASRLVLKAPPLEVLDQLRALDQLDQAPRVHRVVGRIFELLEDRTQGVSLSAVLRAFGQRLRIGVGDPVTGTLTLASTALDAFLRLVAEDSRFRSVADQVVVVEDGAQARFQAGADVPVRGQTTVSQGTVSQAIEYRPTGLVLQVRPHGYADSTRLELKIEHTGVARTTSSGIDSPTITRRDLATVARLKPGESLVVGGLDQVSETASRGLLSSSDDGTSAKLLLILTVDPS